MKTITKIAMTAAFAALAACGGNEEANNADLNMTTDLNATDANMTDMNMTATDNLTVDANNVTVVENTGDATTDANAAANNTM